MIDRLIKEGLITTLCGLIIILFAVVVWSLKDIPATEIVIITGIGSGLLFIKDKHVGLGEKD